MRRDPVALALRRTALLPASPGATDDALTDALADGGPDLQSLIIGHHLAPLWHSRTRAGVFAESRVGAAILYMQQAAALQELDTLFEREGIGYALIKGAATRELVYEDPALRLCVDLDVLVAPALRAPAVRALTAIGYRLDVNPAIVSHEVTLSRGTVSLDLHWDILRPGRVSDGVATDMLQRRVRHGGLWILPDPDAVFLMLVHAAISKHVSTTGVGLHRAADLALWWQRRAVDWPAVYARLDTSGVKVAAWTVLTWLGELLAGSGVDERLAAPTASVRPGSVRARYLQAWLDHDVSDRLTLRHRARLAGFSVFMHDRPSGVWQALRGWRHARATAASNARLFE